MAHNINEGRMFCVGTAWHDIGVRVETEQTAEEAIKLANLNYNVIQSPLYANEQKIDDYVAITREDNKAILGITSPKYKIVQNIGAFSFFDSIVGEGQAVYHSAGALGQGEKIWILAKLPNDIIVNKDDVVEKYLCLSNSHDGKSSLRMYFTPVRVVCQNTLNMSMADAKNGIAIRHTGNIKFKVEEARRILGISIDYYKQYEQIVKQLEEKPLTVEQVEGYFDKLLGIDETEDVSTRKENIKSDLLSLFEGGRGQKTGNIHSAWKAYNSVTEYADHYATIKNLEEDKTNKLKNIWFGTGAKLKEKAFVDIKQLVGV